MDVFKTFVNSQLYNLYLYLLKHFNTLIEYTVGKLLRNEMVITYV